MNTTRQLLEEIVPERRLGRHIEHDDRSWNYQAETAPTLVSVLHKRHGAILNQGNLGSCTGNAMAGLLNTDPRPAGRHVEHETVAVKLYELATELDDYPGQYPPDDTGSSGLAVAKAAQSLGLIAGYAHAFGLSHALGALARGPVITGVPWYEGFDSPDANGLVTISGSIRGGHEFLVHGLDVEARTVRAANSWGSAWGVGGEFVFSWDDWATLLDQQGDVTVATY